MDVFTLLPQRGLILAMEGKRTRVKTTMFNRRAGTADYEMTAASVVKQTVKIAPSSHDALSVFVALRAMPIKPGGGATFPVCDGGRRLNVAVSTEGRETLRTDAVTAPAWRLGVNVTDEEGRLLGRGVQVWISDDARRLPMKLQAQLPVGSFVFELMKTAE